MMIQQKITPFLWFNGNAEEAVQFYTSVFKHSGIETTTYYGEGAFMPKGTVMTIAFRLEGQQFTALNGKADFTFSPAISLVVNCQTQEEIDYYWQQLSADPAREQCGWLQDKFGLSWQIVPLMLSEQLQQQDQEKNDRVMQAVMQMKKLVIADLLKASENKCTSIPT